jgi:thymidylate synthase
MNTIDYRYQSLLQDILNNGITKSDRTGTGTISVFGRQIRHKMSDGFPLLTTKKMYFKGIVTELLWFLRGDTNIKYLVDNDCHIWDGDAYKRYVMLPKELSEVVSDGEKFNGRNLTKEEFINKIKTDDEFAEKWGELGPIYGKQWRNWGMFAPFHTVKGVDQIANLISELKTNPDSRRLMVNAWNVGELDSMVLPPCHYGFQVYTRELSHEERYELCASQKSKMTAISEDDYIKYNIPTRAISLMWNQRSVDVPLGLPFNIASYGLLLEIIAKEVNMVPDELIGNLGDCHIYTNQIDGVKEQITREPFELPTLKHMKTDVFYKSLSEEPSLYGHLDSKDFTIENYKSHPAIKMPLSN